MKRTRMIAAGAVAALTLGVGAGFAAAQTDPTTTTTTTPAVGAPGMQTRDMDEMHAQMRSYMPDDVQAQCDTMHASMQGQMSTMMDRGMMDQ